MPVLWFDETSWLVNGLLYESGCFNYGIRDKASSCSSNNMTREVWVDTRSVLADVSFRCFLSPISITVLSLSCYNLLIYSSYHVLSCCWCYLVTDAAHSLKTLLDKENLIPWLPHILCLCSFILQIMHTIISGIQVEDQYQLTSHQSHVQVMIRMTTVIDMICRTVSDNHRVSNQYSWEFQQVSFKFFQSSSLASWF